MTTSPGEAAWAKGVFRRGRDSTARRKILKSLGRLDSLGRFNKLDGLDSLVLPKPLDI
jgi:hypothetical protein